MGGSPGQNSAKVTPKCLPNLAIYLFSILLIFGFDIKPIINDIIIVENLFCLLYLLEVRLLDYVLSQFISQQMHITFLEKFLQKFSGQIRG